MPAYFDTNVIRYLRTGLNRQLPEETRARISVSPISLVETLCQISDPVEGEAALQSIHRLEEWLPERPVLFEWREAFIARFIFETDIADDVHPIITTMVQYALQHNNVNANLREGARELRQLTEDGKRNKAALFQAAADRIRGEHYNQHQLRAEVTNAIAAALAQTAQVNPMQKAVDQIECSLWAYFEFHRRSVEAAVRNRDYRFDSRDHLNDHFDGEQLLYLAIPENHFVTCDQGFNNLAATPQGARVHIACADVLSDPASAEPYLVAILNGVGAARPGALLGA